MLSTRPAFDKGRHRGILHKCYSSVRIILGVLTSTVSCNISECQSSYDPTKLIQPTLSEHSCCTAHLSNQVWMALAPHTDQTNFVWKCLVFWLEVFVNLVIFS